MKLKTLCLNFFLISFLAISLKAEAYESTSSVSTLSPSTIFDPDADSSVRPRNNLGKMLTNNGFKQESVKEKRAGFTYSGFPALTHYSSYVKTFTKTGYTVRYKYAIYADDICFDNVSFDWIEIKFPSKSAMNEFIDILKASIKRNGNKIFTSLEDSNLYFIGDDDSDLKDGILWPYDQYWIKGNTVTFHETKGMNPIEIFED